VIVLTETQSKKNTWLSGRLTKTSIPSFTEAMNMQTISKLL